jgi:glutamine synthetase
LTEGERVDGSSLFKGMVDPGKSDLYVVPVYKSAFLNPFDDGSLDFICRFLNPQGELAAFPPDNILINASNMLKNNTGMELHALGELEFFLIGDPETDNFPMPKQKGYHASAPFSKSGDVLNDILN